MTYPINAAGVALLHERESFVGHAYPDPYSALGKALQRAGLWLKYLRAPFQIPANLASLSGKPWTIGYGFTEGVREGDRMTRAQADSRLTRELRPRAEGVLAACTVPPNENQLAAMVVLTWNIGLGWKGTIKPKGAKDGFRQSSVLRCHNRGDFAGASRAFRLWNMAQGEVSDGLDARRAAEAALYLRPVPLPVAVRAQQDFAESAPAPIPDFEQPRDAAVSAPEPTPIPQQVDGESKFSQSPINRASVVAGGSAGVAAVAEIAGTMADVKSSADSLGDWLVPILLVVVVALCGYVVWQRIKQRKGGWA